MMMHASTFDQLARLRQQELLDEAVQDRLADEFRATQPARPTGHLRAAYRRVVALCQPVRLSLRRSL